MYYLQHERPCCIGRYELEPKARVCMSDRYNTDANVVNSIYIYIYKRVLNVI